MESAGPPLPPRAGVTSPGASSVVSPESTGSGAGVISPEGPDPNTAVGGGASPGGVALSPGATACPSCGSPFDQGRKRRLSDACGHERCYSCMFTSEVCTLCEQNGECACVCMCFCTCMRVLSLCQFLYSFCLFLQHRAFKYEVGTL